MIYVTSNGRGAAGGIGCLLFALIGLGFFFFGLYWFLKFLWWASPAVFALALLINWRSVAGTGRWLVDQLRANPVNGILTLVFCVVLFPLFSMFLLLKAVGANRLEKLQNQFQQRQETAAGEFVEYEELESKPKEIKKLGDTES